MTITELCDLLQGHDNYLILTHKRPDEDTLGSASALACALNQIGKTARAVCPDKITEKQRSLMGGYSFEDDGSPYDYIITTDAASTSLLGKYEDIGKNAYIMIDHHVPREVFGRYSYVDTHSAACAEIIYKICREFEVRGLMKIDRDIAAYLYAGISSDTGGFIYSNVTPETHRIAAELISTGIKFYDIDELLHITKSNSKIKAEAYAASVMQTYCNGKLAVTYIDSKTVEENGFSNEDLSDIVNVVRAVEGVDVAVSVKEECEGVFKCSLRSRGEDVSKIAAVFCGGGHIRAAGCTVKAGNVKDACEIIISECIKTIEKR